MATVVKVAAAAVNQTPLDWEGNRQRILSLIDEAEKQNVSILCFPEMSITGYGCEDGFYSSHVLHEAGRSLNLIATHSHKARMLIAVGLPVVINTMVYNAVAMISRGEIVGLVPKQNLANDGIHYESRWFKPWKQGRVQKAYIELGVHKQNMMVGDLIFRFQGVRVGFEICEDAWSPDRPGIELSRRGVDIILNPSASHFSFGKHEVRKQLVREGSRAFGASYVYANLLGNESGRVIYDGGSLIASRGEIVAESERFSFNPVGHLTTAVVDVQASRLARSRRAYYDYDGEDHGLIACNDRDYSIQTAAPPTAGLTNNQTMAKREEFTDAVSLGLWDYLRKSGSTGYVVSLSGGADSAAAALLVRTMIHRACDTMGASEVMKVLGIGISLTDLTMMAQEAGVELEDLVAKRALTCVYMGTDNSSKRTLEIADDLAQGLGATFYLLPIQNQVAGYEQLLLNNGVVRELTWKKHDIPRQNIQARTRAPLVWMIANLEHKILLATSNRSEAAVGYATMDGDTCGGLSPLAGIDKAFLLSWLGYQANITHSNRIEGALGSILDGKPTAELRPLADEQTDEDDLMPYAVLDFLERQLVLHGHGPKQALEALLASDIEFHNVEVHREDVVEWVKKFYQLWSRNQWKRERYAPGFHLDDESLDPKTWCRWPILSGGFADELDKLK